jgi:sn-glycerol 3-phosphate transport system substrate-binding protein
VHGHPYLDVPTEVYRRALDGRPPAIVTYHSGAIRQARDTVTRDGTPLFTSVERAVGGRDEILGEPVTLGDIIPPARGYFTYRGDFTSVPLTASTLVLYANTTLLRAAGVDEVPRTWDEVDRACARVAALGRGDGHGVTWPNDGKFFLHWVSQQGGQLVDRDNGRSGRATTVDLTAEPMMSFVDWWLRLYRRGHFAYCGILEDVEGSEAGAWACTISAFANQRVALRVGSSFEAGFVRHTGAQNGFEVAVCQLPHRDGVPPAGNWIGGDSFWLTDGLDEATRDGALAFIQYLNSPHNAAAWHRASGSIPTTNGAIALLEREGWFAERPEYRVPIDQVARTAGTPGSYSPIIPGWHGVQQAIAQAMDDVLRLGENAQTRFARATVEAQQALEEYNTCTTDGTRGTSWLQAGT